MKRLWWFILAAILLVTGCATTASKAPTPLTQAAIIELARANTPDSEIVQRIKASGAVYRLSAVEIQHLQDSGVSNTVIDFMIQDYIEKARSEERERSALYWYSWQPHWSNTWP